MLRYKKANVTKACKALTGVTEETELKIEMIQGTDTREVDKKEVENLLELISRKLETLNDTMNDFSNAADEEDDNDEEVQKNIDKCISDAVHVIDRAHAAKDLLHVLRKQMEKGTDNQRTHHTTTVDNPIESIPIQLLATQFQGNFGTTKIPKFSGKTWEFENFWTLFEELVHKNKHSNLLKFNCLLQCLEGEAKELMKQMKVSNENYPQAVELLQKKYNNPEKIIRELTDKLQEDTAKNNSIEEQRRVLDTTAITVKQLQDLGENLDCQLTKSKVIEKFNDHIQKEVYKKKLDIPRNEWTTSKILIVLESVVSREEELQTTWKKKKQKEFPEEKDTDKSTKAKLKRQDRPLKCLFCKREGHRARDCRTFSNPQQRKEILTKENRCYICTGIGHQTAECKRPLCYNCKGKHHSLICTKPPTTEKRSTEKSPSTETNKQNTKTHALAQTFEVGANDDEDDSSENTVTVGGQMPTQVEPTLTNCATQMTPTSRTKKRAFIPTVRLDALNPKKNKWESISVMLDTGADESYVRKSLAQMWNLPHFGTETVNMRSFHSAAAEKTTFGMSTITVRLGKEILNMEVFVSTNLVGHIRKTTLSKADLHHILREGITINDDSLEEEVEPDMIIGDDYLPEFLKGNMLKLPSGVHLMGTKVGHTTWGKPSTRTPTDSRDSTLLENDHLMFTAIHEEDKDSGRQAEELQQLDTQMKSEFEHSGPLAEEISEANKETMARFEDTIERREDGYYVRLLYKKDHPKLPDNYSIALKRLTSVVKNSSKEVLKMIDDVFKDQVEKKVIEEVYTREKGVNMVHYNPHQPVLTPHKTTKCRVVIDGSSHFRGEPSLNDCIEQGGVLIPDLVDMLLRFRGGKTAIIADVEKAFLQVHLHEDDRDVTRVLWLHDINLPVTPNNIITYRFSRVLFGLNISPFLLGATILHHLKTIPDQVFAEEVAKNLYVDNLILTTDLPNEKAIALYQMTKDTFYDINMNIRGFLSNSQKFNIMIKEKDRETDQELKVLGLQWSSTTDKINMNVKIELPNISSRRTISSGIAGVFDPLGFLVPIMLPLKLMQRELWNEAYQWDTKIRETHEEQWKAAVNDSNGFSIDISRNVIDKSGRNELVTFTDASSEATACCIYVANSLGTHLLVGKSKIRPLKEKWTIPKLETQALKMGTEKTNTVLKALREGNIAVEKITILTDSQIALDWLKSTPGKKEVGMFVANRLHAIRVTSAEMEEHTTVQFGHVRTKENPADIGTRGCDKHTFADSIWWNGPEFIKNDSSKWDVNSFKLIYENEPVVMMNAAKREHEETTETVFDCSRTMKYTQTKRIAAWTLRFIRRCAKNLPEETRKKFKFALDTITEYANELSAEEIKSAEITLLKDQQRDINTKKLRELSNLGPTLNKDGLLVCRGRLELADLKEEEKFPVLILPHSNIANQIIWDSHGQYHQSVQHTMDTVRRRFWIPKLRQQVKSQLRKCVPCQRMMKLPVRYPDTARLPKQRVQRATPFKNIGLDYFGPISYKKEDGSEGSAHGALFTCSVTRLTHIELVPDKSTTEFLQAFRRFIATRGCPSHIVSDNGTCFVLGQKIIDEATEDEQLPLEIQQFLGIKGIEWKFITAYAPWKGGMYERMVKIAKHAFRKAFIKKVLFYEELRTVFHEVAASMNTRPLTYQQEEFDHQLPIRPIDFISQEMSVTLPLVNTLQHSDTYHSPEELLALKSKHDTIEALTSSVKATEEVWKIWNSKYLAELREQHRKRMDKKRGSLLMPKVGQIVLIYDENQPRNFWRMGKVEEVVQGSDGVIRDVKLQVQGGRTISRTINLVVPLELDQEGLETENFKEKEAHEEEEAHGEEPKRYNLRQRKKVNYNDDQPDRIGLAITRSVTPILQVMMIMALITGINTEPVSVHCTSTGLSLNGQFQDFEACVESYCTSYRRISWTRWTSSHSEVWIPPTLKLKEHRATVKISDGKHLQIQEVKCPAIPFCQTIDCTFCWTNLLNPECHISFAILGLGALIFATLMIFHMMCNVPVTLGAPFKVAWNVSKTILHIIGRLCYSMVEKVTRQRKSRAKWRDIVVLCTILCLTEQGQGCQEIDILQQIETVCDNTGHCTNFTETAIHLNHVHSEGCIRMGKKGTTLRDIRIQLMDIEAICTKRTITYTQDIITKVWSTKRCPRMGTCQGDKCKAIKPDSKIPELNNVNMMVGNTGCVESCGGPGCGYFYLSAGCLFYRTYAVPKSPEKFEIFDCIEYQQVARIQLTITKLNSIYNTAKSIEIRSPIGHSTTFHQSTVTVDTIQTPPSPILNTWFIKNNKSVATWIPNQRPNFQCDNLLKNCTLQEKCECQPAEDQMRCTCLDNDIGHLLQRPTTHLPIRSGYWLLEPFGKAVKGRILTESTVSLTLRMTDIWNTKIVKTEEICQSENAIAEGCYSCAPGATAQIHCKSQKEDTMAELECEEESFVIPCSPDGKSTNITFHAAKSQFQKNCSIHCGGKRKTHLEVTGVLKYSGSVWTSIYKLIEGNSTIYEEINLPDLGHLLDSYLAFIKSVLAIIVVAGVIFLLTYSVISNTGSSIIKGLFRGIWILFKLAIYFVIRIPLFIVRTWRRRSGTHLCMNLCMIFVACLFVQANNLHVKMQIPKNNYLLTEKMRILARGEAFENFMNGLAQKLLNMNDEEDSVIRDIEKLLNYKSELCGKLHEAELVTSSLRPTSEELDTLQKLERVKDSFTGHYIRVDFLYSSRRKIYNQIQTTSEAGLWDLEQANKYLDDRGLALQHHQQQEDMTKARIQLALGDINRVIVEVKERTRKFLDDIAQTVPVMWRKMEKIESLLHEALRAVNELAPTREQVNERLGHQQRTKSI